jgi:curved DNA-binding protein
MVLASIGNGWGAFKLEDRNFGLYSRRTKVEYKDYYKVLGLAKSATEKEIKAAYRKLARKHHPDMNQGNPKAEARFKEIGEAYEVLSDPEKRKRYDELGADWKSHRPAAPGAGGWPGGGQRVDFGDFGGSGAAGFSDFFSTFFGPGGGFSGGFPGFDPDRAGEVGAGRRASAEPEVVLTLEEVLNGATRTVELSESGPKSRIEVRIPSGVREGSRVRVAGEKGDGKRRREFHLRVKIAPHPVFERKGEDLQASVKVPPTTAVLGGEVEVPTLEGPVAMKIPEGTTVGQTFRLRGKGLPRPESGGGRGDILVTLSVDLPKSLSARQRELFEELRRLGI